MSDHRPVLVIHGGAGTIAQGQDDPGEARYHAALADILAAGAACLADGGNALDAVSVAVDLLEECPLFNAGHGAVFTSAETHELDAAITSWTERVDGHEAMRKNTEPSSV